MSSGTRLSTGMLLLIVGAAVSLGLGGCGSDSGTTVGPEEKFLGRWELDSAMSTFSLNCTTLGQVTDFPVWVELEFEHGTLTDVSETSRACAQPGLSFSLGAGNTSLTLATPDPYRMAPNNMATCAVDVGTDANGNRQNLVFTFQTATFTLTQTAAGQAPQGVWAASGSGTLFSVDAMTGAASTADTCTYGGTGDNFHQMTRP